MIYFNKADFTKYQSLGNDFIIIEKKISPFQAKKLCDRHFGVGADGVLILQGNNVKIINSDGSDGDMCLNGLRCVAHYRSNITDFSMGGQTIVCAVKDNVVQTTIPFNSYVEKETIAVNNEDLTGYFTEVPNPHFIIFKKVHSKWLSDNGKLIESHKAFPNRTNVEFVWEEGPGVYKVLIYERGVGITLGCGSGGLAIFSVLMSLGKISGPITLKMPGGDLKIWESGQKAVLEADVSQVFKGTF